MNKNVIQLLKKATSLCLLGCAIGVLGVVGGIGVCFNLSTPLHRIAQNPPSQETTQQLTDVIMRLFRVIAVIFFVMLTLVVGIWTHVRKARLQLSQVPPPAV